MRSKGSRAERCWHLLPGQAARCSNPLESVNTRTAAFTRRCAGIYTAAESALACLGAGTTIRRAVGPVESCQQGADLEKLLVVGVDRPPVPTWPWPPPGANQVLGVSLQQPLAFEGFDCATCPWAMPAPCAGWRRNFDPIRFCTADRWRPQVGICRGPIRPGSARTAICATALRGCPIGRRTADRGADRCGVHRARLFHEETSATDSRHPAAARRLAVQQVLADCPALVVRTHAYGWAPAGAEPTLVERIWQSLSAREPFARRTSLCHADSGQRSGRLARSGLATQFARAVAPDRHRRTSPFRMACEVAAAFGLPAPRGGVVASAEQADAAEGISETSLGSRRARRSLETPLADADAKDSAFRRAGPTRLARAVSIAGTRPSAQRRLTARVAS